MSNEENSSPYKYLPWREEKLEVQLTANTTICLTFYGEEKIPREVSFTGGAFELAIPIRNKADDFSDTVIK